MPLKMDRFDTRKRDSEECDNINQNPVRVGPSQVRFLKTGVGLLLLQIVVLYSNCSAASATALGPTARFKGVEWRRLVARPSQASAITGDGLDLQKLDINWKSRNKWQGDRQFCCPRHAAPRHSLAPVATPT
jgi:hypothetical protein